MYLLKCQNTPLIQACTRKAQRNKDQSRHIHTSRVTSLFWKCRCKANMNMLLFFYVVSELLSDLILDFGQKGFRNLVCYHTLCFPSQSSLPLIVRLSAPSRLDCSYCEATSPASLLPSFCPALALSPHSSILGFPLSFLVPLLVYHSSIHPHSRVPSFCYSPHISPLQRFHSLLPCLSLFSYCCPLFLRTGVWVGGLQW